MAIKKVKEPFSTREAAKHVYRQLRLLKELRHANVSYYECGFYGSILH